MSCVDRCGTYAGYSHGCREPECKEASARYRHEVRRVKRERDGIILRGELALAIPGAWADDAACLGMNPNVFFPERGGDFRVARKTCASCSVARQCLELAMANDERLGIWGNTTPDERKAIREERGAA